MQKTRSSHSPTLTTICQVEALLTRLIHQNGSNDFENKSNPQKSVSTSSENMGTKLIGLTITLHSSTMEVAFTEYHNTHGSVKIAAFDVMQFAIAGEWDKFISEVWKRIQPNISLATSPKNSLQNQIHD